MRDPDSEVFVGLVDRRGILSIAVLLLILAGGASAQVPLPQARVGEEVLVAREPGGTVLIEPALATHPTEPDHVLAVGWVFPEGDNGQAGAALQRCAVFHSEDGGRTWARHDFPGGSCADPWVSLTERGAVLTVLGTHPSLPDSSTQLLAYFSPDGGRSWHAVPQAFGRAHDGPRSVAGPDGTVYVASTQPGRDGAGRALLTIPVQRARPGVPHFYSMTRVLPSNLNLNFDGMAVLSDGALVVSYQDYGRKVGPRNWVRAGALERRRSWAMVSDDAGRSFSVSLLITEACYSRPTSLAVDTTAGPFRDRLYHVCAGDDYQSVLLSYSTDRGDKWSEATPIEAPAFREGSRREPQVAVNSEGMVAIAWLDRRDDPAGECYAPYFAASADGGKTFSAPVSVADELSCPDRDRMGFPGRRWPTGGDYFGFAAGSDGRFHVLWPDARSGTFELRTAAVSVRVSGND